MSNDDAYGSITPFGDEEPDVIEVVERKPSLGEKIKGLPLRMWRFLRSVKITTWIRWIVIAIFAIIVIVILAVFKNKLITGEPVKAKVYGLNFVNGTIQSLINKTALQTELEDTIKWSGLEGLDLYQINNTDLTPLEGGFHSEGNFKLKLKTKNLYPKKLEVPFDLHFGIFDAQKTLLFHGNIHVEDQGWKESVLQIVLEFLSGIPVYYSAPIMVVLYAFSCVFFLPGLVLTLASGFLMKWWGLPVVSAGSVLGATLCFILGKTLLRNVVSRQIKKYPRFRAIDRAIQNEGWKVIFLLRLIPLLPFNILNYGLGLTSAGLIQYILASFVGMLPMTTVYVYFGIVIRESTSKLSDLVRGRVKPGGLGMTIAVWVMSGFFIIVVVVVILFIAKRAMKKYMVEDDEDPIATEDEITIEDDEFEDEPTVIKV